MLFLLSTASLMESEARLPSYYIFQSFFKALLISYSISLLPRIGVHFT
jgi:hypothetical protein